MFDRYWGSKESYNQWGTRHVKLISGPEDGPDFDRRRLHSEGMTTSFNSSRRFATSSVSEIPAPERGMPRERRSKSTAFIQSKKNSHPGGLGSSSVTQNMSQTSVGGGDDMQQYGRSPRTWIQKIEDWHRELKTQKEKKKAEKRRNKLDSRGDSGFASTNSNITRSSNMDRGSSIRRTRKSFSSSPPRSYSKSQGGQASQREISDDFDPLHSPVDRKASSVGPNKKKKETVAEVPLARSFSEPFHSPNGVLGRSPWPKPSKRVIPDEIDSQILIRSQDPHSEDFQREEQLAELAERGHSRRDSTRNNRGSTGTVTRVASFHLPSDRRSFSKSILSSSADDHRASTDRQSMNRSSMGSSQGGYAQPAQAQEQRRSGSRRSSLSSSHNFQQQPLERRSLSTAEMLTFMINGAAAVSAPRNIEQKPSRHPGLSDMRRPPLQYPKSTSASSNPYESEQLTASPDFSQLRSTEFQDEDYDVMRSPYMQPKMRRNLSLPGVDNNLQQQQQQLLNSGTPKWMLRTVGKRPPTAESARVIRDRAHVVSYLQRKLSDASSLAGSISRSPRERMDASRLSGSSSNSSRMSDQIFGSNRSAKPYRKGSFSFFDKLSSDLESCLDDLNTSYSGDLEFGSGADLGSDVGSTTMPLPAKKGTSVLDEWRRRSSFAAYQS